jgi:transposase
MIPLSSKVKVSLATRHTDIYTLIETAELNDVDPRAWLTDVLARLQDHPAKRIDELLLWKQTRLQKVAA